MIKKLFFQSKILLLFILINSKDVEIRENDNINNIFFENHVPCIEVNNLNFNSEIDQKKSDNILYEACNLTSKEFNDFYKNNKACSNFKIDESSERAKDYVEDLIQDILNNYNSLDNSSSIELGRAFNLSKNNISKLTKNYIYAYPKYIALLIFLIFIFLLFFFFLICYIFKLFCFVPRNIETKQKWILVVIIIFCAGISILSFIAYIENDGAIQGSYNVACGTSKIKIHLLEGDDYQKSASWIGLNKIKNIISESTEKIISFLNLKANLKNDDLQQTYNSLEATDEANDFLINPIPDNNTNIPSILNKFQSKNDENSFYYKKRFQLASYLNLTKDIGNYYEKITKDIYSHQLKEKEKGASEFFNETINYYDSIKITFNDEIYDKIGNVLRIFTILRKVLFWLTLILCIFGVLIMVLYIYKEIKIHIKYAWILFYIFMLLSGVIAFLFGIIGSYTKDLIYGITSYINKNVTTNENNAFIYHNVSNILIDKCLKGNGEISLDKYEIFKIINDYNNLNIQINRSYNKFDEYFYNFSELINSEENFYKNDLYYLIKTQTPELNEFFDEMRKYTDASVKDSLITNYLNYSDAFTASIDTCPKGYTYCNYSESLKKKDGGKYCFIIDEWLNEEDIRGRYETEESKQIEDYKYVNNLIEFINNYKNFITSYQSIVNKDLKNSKEIFMDFNKKHNEYKVLLNDVLKNLNISYIFEGKIKDNESVVQLTNCEFIQRDVYKVFYEGYFSFAMKLTNVSIIQLIIGILETFLFIIYYILFANMVRDRKEVEEITKMNNEICGPIM